MENNSFQKRSRQGAFISLFGFVIVLLVFVFAASRLQNLNHLIEERTVTVDSLDLAVLHQDSAIAWQKDEVAENQFLIRKLVFEINKLKDPIIRPQTKAVAIPGVKDPDGKQIYDFTIWVTASQYALNTIKQVDYQFGHKSFNLKTRISSDGSNGFLVSYRGWGCLSGMVLSVLYKDGTTDELYFDMCEGLGW